MQKKVEFPYVCGIGLTEFGNGGQLILLIGCQ